MKHLKVVLYSLVILSLVVPTSAARIAHYSCNEKKLEVADLATGKITVITRLPCAVQTQISWSPDGKWLFYDCINAADPAKGGVFQVKAIAGSKPRKYNSGLSPFFIGNDVCYVRDCLDIINRGSSKLALYDLGTESNISITAKQDMICYPSLKGFTIFQIANRKQKTFSCPCEQAYISPGGNKVLVVNNRRYSEYPIYVIYDLKSGKKTKLKFHLSSPTWETNDTLLDQIDSGYLMRYRLSTGKSEKLFRISKWASIIGYTSH